MNTQIKALHCFLVLIETGNYTKAAEKLHLTQPTLSKMVQRLEEHLHETLLFRNNQKVTLTQAGQLFEQSARQIIGLWHRLEEDIHSLHGLNSGRLRLGICPMMSSLFTPLLVEFRHIYPGIKLDIFEHGGFGCEQALLEDKLDIAFTALPTIHSDDLVSRNLIQFPLLVCLPENHPLLIKEQLSWEDLALYPFILYNEDFALSQLIHRFSQRAGVKLDVAFRSGQWDFLASMVEAEMGIAILPEPICQKLQNNKLAFRPMKPVINWDLAFIWRKNLPLTPAAEALLQLSQKKS